MLFLCCCWVCFKALDDWEPKSMCDLLLCHELSRPLGPSGTGGDKNKPGDAAVVVISAKPCYISILRCSLHVSVANSQKTRWMFQPSARLNLCLTCISLWRYPVQCFTLESVYLHLALQCTLTLILLFYSISAYYLCYFILFKSQSVPFIPPLYMSISTLGLA